MTLGDPTKPLVNPAANSAPPPGPPAAGGKAPVNKGPLIDGLHIRGLYLENPDRDAVVTAIANNLSSNNEFLNGDKGKE